MDYIFVMSFSGSMYLLLYYLFKIFAGRKINPRWHYVACKFGLLYFLLPLAWLKELYKSIWCFTVAANTDMHVIRRSYQTDKVITVFNDILVLSDGYKRQLLVAGIWAFVVLAIVITKVTLYFRKRREILRAGADFLEFDKNTFLKEIKQQYHITQTVGLLDITNNKAAFTIGLTKPIIVMHLSESQLENELLLRHELIHIKRKDAFWNLLGYIVLCIHWFNPFAYAMVRSYREMCEESCDELVLCGRTQEEKKQYAVMLVNHANYRTVQMIQGNTFMRGKSTVKKRVNEICNSRKKWNRKVAGVLVALLVSVNSITVFAYQDVYIDEIQQTDEKGDFLQHIQNCDEVFIRPENDQNHLVTSEMPYTCQFVDEMGNIYQLSNYESPGMQEKTVCPHSYINGTKEYHFLNGQGGCTLVIYEAKICTKCHKCIEGDYITTATFTQCIH